MAAKTTQPNIVVLMTDQQRVGLTGAEGGPDSMPRVDALFADGARFDRAYTSCPACVPARTSLLTGRFPSAHRVRQNSNAEHAFYSKDLLDVLRAAGYSLHFSGKPHMHPGPQDFDTFHGPFMHDRGPTESAAHEEFDAWLHGLDHAVTEEPTPFPLESQLPYRIVDGAIRAVDGAPAEDPYFLWLSFPEPHNPYQVPEPYFSMFDEAEVPERLAGPEALDALGWRFRWLHRLIEEKRPGFDQVWRRYRANYLGMLRMIDDQIGRLVDHLADQPGGLENTVFVFLTDHGDFVGDYGLQRKGAGLPEALTRIPLAVAGPGVETQHRSELVSMVDLLPTIAEWVGQPIPPGVQGRSLAPLLRGGEAPPSEFSTIYAEHGYGGVSYAETDRPPLHFPYQGYTFDELNSVTQSGEMRMVVGGRYKLIVDDRSEVFLYDLESDPAETKDLSDDAALAGVREDLYRQLVQWLLRVADDLPEGDYQPKSRPHNWRWA
ncbi:sulfatase-like hydrolase/transferase [Ruania halotolerans]|uniref:sulfatase-like hydrolase/transferase n=1 Tax=Ruania halotolerans TaxID=2897773 RepID=UPI001E59CAF5|nr:sulfatase-like hydrolase/transferase [Ruania halotolerans]UFU06623.1 sulfatase-like hydrolase/transferase [Ruania halotolerans]